MPLTPETWRNQQTVNATTAGVQQSNDIIQLTNGNILVSWGSDNDAGVGSPNGLDILGQIFDPLGNPVGSEFLLNTVFKIDDEYGMRLAATDNGGFIGVYADEATATSLRLQEYDATGASINSETIQFDNNVASPNYSNPQIAVSSPTSAMIVYIKGSVNFDIVGKIYNPTTDLFGPEIPLIDAGPNFNLAPDVTVLDNGNYVITAHSDIGGIFQISYRIVDAAGNNVLATTVIAEAGSDFDPSVTALTGGGFVLAWSNDGNDVDGHFQTFNAAGVAVTNIRRVDNGGGGASDDNRDLEVIPLNDGGFAIFFSDHQAGQDGLRVEHFDSAANLLGSRFLVGAGNTAQASAILLEDGRLAVTWRENLDIQMEILDIRDGVNTTPAYTGNWQVGTVGADIFNVDAGADIVHGWDGADQIYGTAGAETINGDNGNDLLLANGGNDIINGGAGIDIIGGGDGNDTIHGNEDIDKLFGNNGNDTVYGDSGNDALYGGAGSDKLYGGKHDDYLSGQNDADKLWGDSGNDTLLGDGGIDKLYGGTGNDILGGGADSDLLDGESGNDKLYGGDGNDLLIGGTGNDLLLGSIGLDTLYGDSGIDILGGGDGNDTVNGGSGNDQVFGNNGNDLLRGDDGDDTMYGGNGNDRLFGGIGDDDLFGQTGDDTLYGEAGADLLGGFTGNDYLYGGTGNDSLFGNDGNDILFGQENNDALFGGNGNDVLLGGSGNDILNGQAGTDTFSFSNGFGVDVITDFADNGLEKINLINVANITNFADLSANHTSFAGGSMTITDGANTITVNGYSLADFDAGDFLF